MDDPFLGQLYVMSVGDHLSDVEKAKLAPSLWRASALVLPGSDSRVRRQCVASKLVVDVDDVNIWLHAAGIVWPPAPPRPKRTGSRMYRPPKPRQDSQPVVAGEESRAASQPAALEDPPFFGVDPLANLDLDLEVLERVLANRP
jgi:hypothetical protein